MTNTDAKLGVDKDEVENFDDPFNPNHISIDSKKIAMDTILRRLIQNTIKLNPDFQRNEVWNEEKKSQLIESLMLKIPLPMFYVSADEKGDYTVVDGLQRLSTIRSFILGDAFLKEKIEQLKGYGFKLKKLEFWKEYEDKTFQQLPIHIQNRILETEFNFTVVNPGTPEEVKRNIFKRINTGGLPLNSQEIRNALYIGHSTKLLKKLSKTDTFQKATYNSVSADRMEDRELILRFLSFLLRNFETYKRTINVDTFLSDTMIILNAYPKFDNREFKKLKQGENFNMQDWNTNIIEKIPSLFEIAMLRSNKLFDKHAFRKSYGKKQRSPINKSLFEMWCFFLSQISETEFWKLLENKQNFLSEYSILLEDNDFGILISRDSMKHLAVNTRFKKIQTLIQKYISE